jgi:hypothetical protein
VSEVGGAGVQLAWPAEWSTSRPKKRAVLGVGFIGVLAPVALYIGVSELLLGTMDLRWF